MESSPRKMRGSFIEPWEILNFHLLLGGLSQMGALKFSIIFWLLFSALLESKFLIGYNV